jgi:hypothetical protein
MTFDVTVAALDAYGHTAVGYLGAVTFSSSDTDPGVVLPVDYTFTANDGGVHVFAGGFTLVTAGNQTLTATDTGDTMITGSAIVSVDPGPAPPGSGARQLSRSLISRGSPDLFDVPVIGTTGPNPEVQAMRPVQEVTRVDRFFALLNDDDSGFPLLRSKHQVGEYAEFSVRDVLPPLSHLQLGMP